MKKIWIKLIKHYQGGEKTHYMLVNESVIDSKNEQNEIMEEWGENSDGGHNYGYKVDMHFLDEGELPPIEWIEKNKISLENQIGYLNDEINEAKKMIKLYEGIIENKK